MAKKRGPLSIKNLSAKPPASPYKERRDRFQRVASATAAIIKVPGGMVAIPQLLTPTGISGLEILGTGFLVHESGVFVTAKHVVQAWLDAQASHVRGHGPAPDPIGLILVSTAPDTPIDKGATTTPGSVSHTWRMHLTLVRNCAVSTDHDVGVLAVQLPKGANAKPLRITEQLCMPGDEVAVCGYPFGMSLHRDIGQGVLVTPSFSRGIVSAVFPHMSAPRAMRTLFQLDAMINGGNSGGPVFDVHTGQVCGIVVEASQIATPPPPGSVGQTQGQPIPTGLARAVDIHVAADGIKAIVEGPKAV